jgi:chemotaxis protein methyltransferase CheR
MEQTFSVDYGYLRQIVFNVSQNVLDASRDYLFDTRLTKILRNQGMAHLDELVRRLRAQKNIALEHEVAEAMTIWSGACATGQEAYSLAMLLLEHFPMLVGWNIVIEGTDICSEVVQRAQAGRYHRIEINRGLPARYVVRYFDHIGEDWIVKPEVRKLSNFRRANLCGPSLPFNRTTDRFDVIFLRNVMLYFDQPTRRTLMAGVHHLLAPDGLLFLGSSEQPADPSIWTPVLAGGTCYFRPRQPS